MKATFHYRGVNWGNTQRASVDCGWLSTVWDEITLSLLVMVLEIE